uniref:Uncharacterized protein n=1 Tax=Araucaria cunninghamii TaxID=56994 RepID=A0A0D6R0H9_ARACU
MEGERPIDGDLREGKSPNCRDGKPGGDYQEYDGDLNGEGMTVLDFDVLCATVAMQSERLSFEFHNLADREAGGGVQRMWEGGLMDCLEDKKILLETACCPCSTFGKNMRRAGFGTCIGQGTAHLLFVISALISYIAFGVTKLNIFLYVGIGITLLIAAYAGYHRTQMRRRFNIKGSDSGLDDCMNHLLCSCCTLCQEARTLEMNNVQDGIWRGRGDTILVGSYRDSDKSSLELNQPAVVTLSPEVCSMNKTDHAWSKSSDQSEPLVGQKCDSFL